MLLCTTASRSATYQLPNYCTREREGGARGSVPGRAREATAAGTPFQPRARLTCAQNTTSTTMSVTHCSLKKRPHPSIRKVYTRSDYLQISRAPTTDRDTSGRMENEPESTWRVFWCRVCDVANKILPAHRTAKPHASSRLGLVW